MYRWQRLLLMRISTENIQGLTAQELIDFVAAQRYDSTNTDLLESEDFQLLPASVRHLIFILDFETEYEMQGILTLLQNSLGKYLPQIIDSFHQTGNTEIALCLSAIADAFEEHGVSWPALQREPVGVQEFDILPVGIIAKNQHLTDMIFQIDERLGMLIADKCFWKNVQDSLQRYC